MRIPMAIVLAATFALPGAAEAATQVSNDGTKTILLSGFEPADVRIDTVFGPPFGIQSQLTDRRGGLVVGPGCIDTAPVVCPGDRLEITLNGGDDRIVSLGDSNQTVSGGAGADVIRASSQSTTLSAGGGDDVVEVNSTRAASRTAMAAATSSGASRTSPRCMATRAATTSRAGAGSTRSTAGTATTR